MSAWITVFAALLGLLALARASRLRPALRPLLAPAAGGVLGLLALRLLEKAGVPSSPWLSLLVLVPVLVLVVRGAGIAVEGLLQRRRGEPPPALLGSVVAVMLYGVGGGFIAHQWFGVELTPFLATSAVVGAVVGLALQDTLGNLFAGIALHTEAPFRVGNWVRLGDRDGCVEQVSWRAVRLRTWDGDTLTIPNNEAARHAILNYSEPRVPHSRVLCMGVNYHTPPNKVVSVLQGLMDQIPLLPERPRPIVRIIGYHDFFIQYEVRYFLDRYDDYRVVEGEIYRLIWYHFRRHGIEVPFPIRNVYLHQVEPEVDGGEQPVTRLERALQAIDLFRPLTEEEIRAAAASFRRLHYAAGERIIEQAAPGDSFFVIDRGEVDVIKTVAGVVKPLARLLEGQFFGEMALLTGEKRSAAVVAVTDVDLFTIDKVGFERILAANPAIAVEISTILSERRDALSQAEEEPTAPGETEAARVERKHRILGRIRSYFGL